MNRLHAVERVRDSRGMKRLLLLAFLALGLLTLAVGGWVVQGLRWALAVPLPRPRAA